MLPHFRLMAGLLGVLALSGLASIEAQPGKEPPKKSAAVWTDPADPSLPVDFKIQGEYVGEIQGGGTLGCQIIALGKGTFQAVIMPGGLPGAGWDGTNKILLEGQLDGDGANFKPAVGTRKYLDKNPLVFSATSKFPPVGQKDFTASVQNGTLSGKTDDGKTFNLKKADRVVPTLGLKRPAGAIVLFDGTNTDEWNGGRLDKATGFLNNDNKDFASKRKFNNYIVHAEFFLPFSPEARGQDRGNSGFYQVNHYEAQILDSFGLDGKDNECGGIYLRATPKVNACLPPLTWQTYDIDFTNAVQQDGKKVANARITVRHNGILIHDDVDIKGTTVGARREPEGTPGPFLLQGHGSRMQYKNIWVVEKK